MLATIDFETEGIESAPYYPPIPVGVSVKIGGARSKYYAWGHPYENNCTKQGAYEILHRLWINDNVELIFQNAKFDLEVARQHFTLPLPRWDRVHDTMFLLFLNNPRGQLSLKPASAELLDMPAEEQDALHDWIVSNVPEAKRAPKRAGAYISLAPGKLTGLYATGDTDRTYKLFRLLLSRIVQQDMDEAYNRERRLLPIIMELERRGVRMNIEAIKSDIPIYQRELNKIERRLRRKIGNINFNSSAQLSDALLSQGLVDALPRTKKGNYSVKIAGLKDYLHDKKLYDDLNTHSSIEKMLNTFLFPWLERMEKWNIDRLYPRFNQVRGERYGARTGRLSGSDPNFQQLNRKPEDKRVPFARRYVLPEEGHILLGRDYSQQELRILAHYEGAALQRAFISDPRLDLHTYAQEMIKERTGKLYPRPHIKNCGFGIIYGIGGDKLGHMIGEDNAAGRKLKQDYFSTFPTVRKLMNSLSEMWEDGMSIRTRGGRIYYAEEPSWKNGKLNSKYYKALNTLIQGSAADHTKEATIRLNETMGSEAPMLLTVHDEFLFSVPANEADDYMHTFQEEMNFDYFDVPMRSDGKRGYTWGTMVEEE